jgi:uncharacterized protein
MDELRRLADEFLGCARIAVAGVSRDGAHVANVVFRRLRDAGYSVVALNPNAPEVEGAPAYTNLSVVPGGVDAVFIATRPDAAPGIVQQCVDAGVRHVWLHRSFGTGSVSAEAVALGERHGLRVIAGACPMMFIEPVDAGHRCMRWLLKVTGGLPTPAGTPVAH